LVMKKKNNKKINPKSTMVFRTLAGVYLLYLTYKILIEWDQVKPELQLLTGTFIVIFTAVGIFLMISSLIQYARISRNPEVNHEPAENEMSEVENETSEAVEEVTKTTNQAGNAENEIVENEVVENENVVSEEQNEETDHEIQE